MFPTLCSFPPSQGHTFSDFSTYKPSTLPPTLLSISTLLTQFPPPSSLPLPLCPPLSPPLSPAFSAPAPQSNAVSSPPPFLPPSISFRTPLPQHKQSRKSHSAEPSSSHCSPHKMDPATLLPATANGVFRVVRFQIQECLGVRGCVWMVGSGKNWVDFCGTAG